MARGSGHYEAWEAHDGEEWWEDLSEMAHLTEESLLAELKRQYFGHRYMTWVGDILCVMNPFQLVSKEFVSDSALERYNNIPTRQAWPPHNFALADLAFQKMLLHAKNQVVTISGESGAGKTESAKLFIKMIVHSSHGSEFDGLEEKLLKVNPILEAFGNAKTAMNNNSSRFGKFVQILFSKEGAIQGAMQTQYLLEKSRVCQQGAGEQNFHIFYIMFAWLNAFEEYRDKLELPDPHEMKYFTFTPGPLEEDDILDCLDQFIEGGEENPRCEISVKELKETIDVLGFTPNEVENIFNTLAGIAKLSKIEFDGDEEGCTLAGDRAFFESICKNLGVDPPALEFALTTHVVELPGNQQVEKKYSPSEAMSLADSTAKDTYGKLFHFIVEATNKKLSAQGSTRVSLAMGVLDIFGFEDFERQGGKNSLEQLCINLANEQLQYFFTEHIFGQELAAYAAEGIDGANISYEDNQPMLNLILGKRGMFDTLNEQSKLKRSTDQTCLDAYHQKFEKEKKLYIKPRMADPVFSLNHYAGAVQYTVTDFLLKNRDALAIEVTGTMAISNNHVISLIYGGEEGAIGTKKKVVDATKALAKAKQSVKTQKGKKLTGANYLAKQFKASLVSLMDDLNKAEPHFIRCIKPNQSKSKEWEVDDEYSTRQLRYTGMLDTTRIRREGYPSRPTFADFMERYKILGHPMSKEVPPTGPNCQEILNHAGVGDAQIGKTKVFMKHYHGQALDEKLKPFSSAAMLIGKFGIGFLARARCRPIMEHKRKQDKIVKAWLDTVPKFSSPFLAACDAGKQEDGAAMLGVWKKREEEGKPPPASQAKAHAAVEQETQKRLSRQKTLKKGKGKPTRADVIAFYKEMGDEQGAGQTEDGRFCAWFHGIVSRVKSEELLRNEQDGTFLIRLAESRYGYSLSIIWRGRVKHFAIDLDEKGMHTIRGNSRKYRYLNQIVAFHKNHSITDQGDRLLYPCNPGGERHDLVELSTDD